jgi:hypothetical protein
MKTQFIQPRFDGNRFNEHTLPVDVARDLAAYETLVVELAKHLYLKDHPERQRVPKGFNSNFHLHLEKVDDGSAMPLLSVVVAGVLELSGGGNTYFERARDLITECVAAPAGQLPPAFPRELLSHFNQVGRSLRADETLELPRSGTTPARLTPERRKSLVLAADSVYEREVELSGAIEEADWAKSTFRLRLSDGNPCVVPMPETFHHRAREFGGRPRHQVTVKGIATYDSWDRLQKVISVESLEIQLNATLSAKFDELAELADGWHDGTGKAPNKEKLIQVAEKLVAQYPEALPLPVIVPTHEGNLLLEWNTARAPSVDIALEAMRADFHSFGDSGLEIEEEFSLISDSAWDRFFSFLNANLK